MAGKEDAMKNFGAVGVLGMAGVPLLGGRTLAVEEEEFKVEGESDWIPRALLGSFRSMQMPADKEADWMSAFLLRPDHGSHIPPPAAVEEEEEAIIGAKRSAGDPKGEAVGGSSDGGKPAAAADATGEAAAGDISKEASVEECVEMTEDYLRWLLAQTRETDPVPTLADYRTRNPKILKILQENIEWMQAAQDEFFEFQASVCDKLERNKLVIVPAAAAAAARNQLQEEIDEFWYGLLKEYDDADSKTDVAEPSSSN